MDDNNERKFRNPFLLRPWMSEESAALSATAHKTFKGIVAGGLAGGIKECISYPTEYVKTQLQLDEKGELKRYDGVGDCIKKTFKRYGVLGFYRGISVLIYGSIPKVAVRFGGFETAKSHMVDEVGNLSVGGRMLCGLAAGVTEAILAVTPMETIKVRLINDRRSATPRYKGFLHGVRLIVKEYGIGGIYKGATATIMKQGSNQMIRFLVVETAKDYYRGGDPKKHVPTPFVGLFGVIAGVTNVFANTPMDVVKTRMQGLDAAKYKSTWDCCKKIWINEGSRAFYKGTMPRLLRVCLDTANTFMIYDNFMILFNKVWPD